MPTTAIEVAERYAALPVRESQGKNRSPEIDRFNQLVRIPLGSPYCASGVSECFFEATPAGAHASKIFPYTGGSQAIKSSFKNRGKLFTDPQHLQECKGAGFGWTNDGDAAHGHTGLIKGRLTTNGKVVGILTIEFNTDASTADRDGDGCYEVRRVLCSDGLWRAVDPITGRYIGAARRLWFYDTSDIAGGAWWK